MFDKVTRTWNPCIIYPCYFNCVYCWTRYFIEKKLLNSPAGKLYKQYYGKPTLIEDRLRVRFKKGEIVFTQDVGDLFAPNVPDEYILKVLDVIRKNPQADFLLLTKNPSRVFDILCRYSPFDPFQENVIFGVTVETDNDELYKRFQISRAPPPGQRLCAFSGVLWLADAHVARVRAWISIEPIIDFSNPRKFAEAIITSTDCVDEVIVYVGYDNYNVLRKYKIPEPPLHKTLELIDILKQHGIEVRTKTLRKAWNEQT